MFKSYSLCFRSENRWRLECYVAGQVFPTYHRTLSAARAECRRSGVPFRRAKDCDQ